MIARDLSFNLLLTKFGTNSFGMQLIPPVTDTLARKQICLMLHHPCQRRGGVVMHCRLPQPCVSVEVRRVAWMIERSDSLSTGRYGSISSVLSGNCGFLPDCPPIAGWASWDIYMWANHWWASSSLTVWPSGRLSLTQTDSICLPQHSAPYRNQTCQDQSRFCMSYVPCLYLVFTMPTDMHSEERHPLKDLSITSTANMLKIFSFIYQKFTTNLFPFYSHSILF